MRGSGVGGLRCEILAAPGEPAGSFTALEERCRPGEKRWCGTYYETLWGQVRCGADGRWQTRRYHHREHYDCQFADGRRPDTLCACYHPFVRPECCERPDCKVVLRDDGMESSQLCPESEGKRCDYCDRQNPCAVTKSRCLHTIYGESFCAERCDPMDRCPLGHECLSLKGPKGQEERYCVLDDRSCYYDHGQSP